MIILMVTFKMLTIGMSTNLRTMLILNKDSDDHGDDEIADENHHDNEDDDVDGERCEQKNWPCIFFSF